MRSLYSPTDLFSFSFFFLPQPLIIRQIRNKTSRDKNEKVKQDCKDLDSFEKKKRLNITESSTKKRKDEKLEKV